MPPSLDRIRELRAAGGHEEAREYLVEMAKLTPGDAEVLYEAASVHDYLDLEAEALSYYLAAIGAGLSGENLRSAYLGLGSTYRILGRYQESLDTFEKGLRHFPEAREFHVFSAMTYYNLGRYHEAVSVLLRVIADTTGDSNLRSYERAIRLYAGDLDMARAKPRLL
jgi:tetratricopeptide (TPR) repeat protein